MQVTTASSHQSTIAAIKAMRSQVADASCLVFSLETYELVHVPPAPFEALPWPSYDAEGAQSLPDLFDTSSRSDLDAARARAKVAAVAITTVRSLAGHPLQATIHAFGPQEPHAVAILEDAVAVRPTGSTGTDGIRTRVVCDDSGNVISCDGPPGSYAGTDLSLGPWGEKLVATEDVEELRSAIKLVVAGEPYVTLLVAGAAPSLHFSVTVARSNGNFIVDYHDRSHHIAAISALERSQVQFDQLSATLPVGVFVAEPGGRIRFASQKLQEMVGSATATDLAWLDSMHPDDQSLVAEAFALLPEKRQFALEVRTKFASGDYTWARWVGSDVRAEDGTLEFIVGFVEDISEWRDLNSKIAYQASFDGLTDLPNRMTLVTELRDRLEQQSPTTMTGVLFIDLDGFKLINDTQGHSVGDIVLVEVAQRFRRALRPSDVIGRFGGDEFVVVAGDITSYEEAEVIGRRLHDILSTPVLADGRIITVNASIGIALSEHAPISADQLIGDADIAMYEAKASGRNRSVLFDATLRARASQRFDMTADLRHARRRRELRLEYQPMVDLKSGKMIGAEALVRWDHPSMGRISPALFIPLAEEIGLIDDVGEWVIEQSCADLDRLRTQGLVDDDFAISVNASAQQFSNVAILATSSLASLDQFGLRPANIRFELTESVPLTQIPDAANRIRQLTNYGFGLAIDDFGTGYSSLGYLTMLPFDVLKLDLSLTAQIEPGSPALAVVDSLTRMSHEMGFRIVAEGIETDNQQQLLTEAGVQLGQGYNISRPVPLNDLIDILGEQKGP